MGDDLLSWADSLPKNDDDVLSWADSLSAPTVNTSRPSKYAPLFQKHAAANNLDPDLLRAMTQQESTFDPNAVSPKGATGLMQLMPATAKRFGVTDINDPDQNIGGGAKYIKFLLDRYNGDVPKALAAYNAGEGNVDKYKGIPPFKETRNYVKKITGNYSGTGYAPQVNEDAVWGDVNNLLGPQGKTPVNTTFVKPPVLTSVPEEPPTDQVTSSVFPNQKAPTLTPPSYPTDENLVTKPDLASTLPQAAPTAYQQYLDENKLQDGPKARLQFKARAGTPTAPAPIANPTKPAFSDEPVVDAGEETPIEPQPTTTFPRLAGRAPMNGDSVLGVVQTDPKQTPEERLRFAANQVLSKYDVTPQEVDKWIADSKAAGVPLLVGKNLNQPGIAIKMNMLSQIKPAHDVRNAISMEQSQTDRPKLAPTNYITGTTMQQIRGLSPDEVAKEDLESDPIYQQAEQNIKEYADDTNGQVNQEDIDAEYKRLQAKQDALTKEGLERQADAGQLRSNIIGSGGAGFNLGAGLLHLINSIPGSSISGDTSDPLFLKWAERGMRSQAQQMSAVEQQSDEKNKDSGILNEYLINPAEKTLLSMPRFLALPGGIVAQLGTDAFLQDVGRKGYVDPETVKTTGKAIAQGAILHAAGPVGDSWGRLARVGTVAGGTGALGVMTGDDPETAFKEMVKMAIMDAGFQAFEGKKVQATDGTNKRLISVTPDGEVVELKNQNQKPDAIVDVSELKNEAKTEIPSQPASVDALENVPTAKTQTPLEQVTGNTEPPKPAELTDKSTVQPNAAAPESPKVSMPSTQPENVSMKGEDIDKSPRTLSHPNPDIDGKPIVATRDDGKVVVPNENNKSGVSVVTDRSATPTDDEKGFEITNQGKPESTAENGVAKVIAEKNYQRDEAQREAETSSRTGLPNNVALEKAKPRIDSDPETEATYVDLDNFKSVNDKNSHAVGDQAIADAGEILQRHAKAASDKAQVFHVSGDEYVIASPKGTGQEILKNADAEFSQKKYGDVQSGMSGHTADTVQVADDGLKQAKAARKGQPATFTEYVSKQTGSDNWYVSDSPAKSEEAKGAVRIKKSDYLRYEEEFNKTPEGIAAKKALEEVRAARAKTRVDKSSASETQPGKPETSAETETKKPNERSLPKTLDAAQLEGGTNRTYEPETLKNTGLDRGRKVVAEKGLDGAKEFVLHGEGIDWAPTGYAVMEAQRAEIGEMRKTDPKKADELYENHREFVNQFAEKATEKGQSIVGIKAIEEFAPDRAAYLLNKVSRKSRGRDISEAESDKITRLGLELEQERNRSRNLEEQLAKKNAVRKPEPKEKKGNYLTALEKASNDAKAAIVAKLGKMDLQGLKKSKDFSGQKGAIGEQRALPGDAELLAQYAAGRLHKVDTVDALDKELMEISNGDAEPFLPEIRKRAYQIRQEARIKALEDAETPAGQRRTILQHIRNEIKAAEDLKKAQDEEAAAKHRELVSQAMKATKADAREQAKKALADQRAKDKARADEARQQAKEFRRSLIEAKAAEMKGYRASVRAQREAAKNAELWDTPIRNMAEEAKARLVTADPKSPNTIADLASVGAEKFLRDTKGGVQSRKPMLPIRFYREMEAEYPDLVTRKNRGEIYKQAYQQTQDAINASKEAARLRSASAESKKVWEEEGMDIDKQAILIQRARNQRRQTEIRNQMAQEFNNVSQSKFKRVGKEILNLPRGMQTSLNMHLGRQGLFNVLTHPISVTAKGAVPGTLKGFFSGSREDFLQRVKELKEAPGYDLAEESGVNFSELPGITTNLKGGIEEDELQGSWGQKIPWVRRSTQGFILGMNTERLLQFNRYAAIGDAQGYTPENNPKFFNEIAEIVNDATGRGTALKAIEKAMGLTNQIMYSNRLKVSQVKIINDLFNPYKYTKYDPVTRKIMAGEMVKTVVSLTALYGALIAMGGKTVNDPDDPDFFKVTFGHTHYDLTGGTGATLRFAYRFVKSVAQTVEGEKLAENEQPFNIAAKFARNKLAPWPSAAIDYLSGKNAVGEPANFEVHPYSPVETAKQNIAVRLLTPIVVEDIANGLQDGGYIGGAKTLPVLAGVSEQTYPPHDEVVKTEMADKKATLKTAKSPEEVKKIENSIRSLKSQQSKSINQKYDEATPEEREKMMADPATALHIRRHLKSTRSADLKARREFNRMQQGAGGQ